MARIHRYTKGKVTLSDTLVGTDVENQKATVNIPIAAIVDLAIDYFSVNGNGDGINQSLLDVTTSIDGNTAAIATYKNIVNTHTSDIGAIVTRTEKLESTFDTNVDGTLTISAANITNFAETIASQGFASATTLDTLSSRVQQIINGQLTLGTYATISQLGNTTSTLQGSIATLQNTLTTGYKNYADGIILTDSFSTAVSGLITESTADLATAQSVFDLETTLTTYIDNEIASSSTAGITGSQLTTVLADYALAQTVTDLNAQLFDAEGNVNESFATSLLETTATDTLATAQSVTTLESTVNGYTATLDQTASTVSDISGQLQSSYGLSLTAGNAVAGMTFLADGTTNLSEVKFVADTFKIDRPGGAISPFVVNPDGTISLNGQVTFTSASTGQGIDYDDLSTYLSQNNYTQTSDLPDTSAFLNQAALATYLQNNGYVTGDTAGITEVQLLNILSGQDATVNTVINGGAITTGIIASGDFAMPVNSALSGFSTAGMGINLDNSSIHAEQFYINSDGTANFGGTHSAGSIGSWTVDSSGALKDGEAEIVLAPNGDYVEVGTEKLIMSSENLPAISPNAGVSMDYAFTQLGGNDPLTYYVDEEPTRGVATYSGGQVIGYTATGTGPKSYKYTLPSISGTKDALGVANNISYNNFTGSKFGYRIPVAANQLSPELSLMVQPKFLNDYGVPRVVDVNPDAVGYENPTQLSDQNLVNEPGVFTYDYTIKLVVSFKLMRSGGDHVIYIDEKILANGSASLNAQDFAVYANVLLPAGATVGYTAIAEGRLSAGTGWGSSTIEREFTPPIHNDYTGEIKVEAKFDYTFENISVYAANVSTTSSISDLNIDTGIPYFWVWGNNFDYTFTGGAAQTTSLANVLFTGASPKTNIGLNGIQVRGNNGYCSIGDSIETPGVSFQNWGDAQIYGTLTSNASQTFSDKNLKENITPISSALDTISKLAPDSFNWRPDMQGLDSGKRYGFIAQDIQEVLPSIVKQGNHLTLEHNNIISINTAAIKELVDKINTLEEEIKKLKENNG